MCVIAAQLDMQRMDPAHPVAKLSGVSSIHEQMLAEMGLQGEEVDGEEASVILTSPLPHVPR